MKKNAVNVSSRRPKTQKTPQADEAIRGKTKKRGDINTMADQLMQLVTVENGELRTTTLAIAEGMDVEHKAVIQLVRNYRNDLEEFGGVTFETRPFETAGGIQSREIASLNEQQATLIMTYMKNTEIARSFKKRLVKAFYELAKRQHTDPLQALNDPATMRGLLLTYSEKVIELESRVSERDKMISVITPKAEIADRISLADGSMCITNAAKTLQIQPKLLFNLLSQNKFIYRRPGCSNWVAYQDKLQTGYLEHKITTVERTSGDTKTVEQVLVTPKGLVKLAAIIGTPMC